jgi:hypothetical protein
MHEGSHGSTNPPFQRLRFMPRKAVLICLFVCTAVVIILNRPKQTAPPSLAEAKAPNSVRTVKASPPTPNDQSDAVPAKGPSGLAQTPYARFDDWTKSFLDSRADLAEGVELAKSRRAEMAELIKKDPKAALEAAVPMAVRQKLPQAIVDQLEERVSGRGFYGVLIATDFENGTSEIRREVVLNGQTYHAYVYGRRLSQVTQDKVPMWGIAVPNPENPDGPKLLPLSPDPIRPIEPGEIVAATPSEPCPVSTVQSDTYGTEALAEVGGKIEKFCMASHIYKLNDRLAADIGLGGSGDDEPPTAKDAWSQGPKTLLYMRVTFPDDPTEPITEDEAYARMDEVNQWFIENSYNTTEIIPTVTPLLMMPYPKAFYSLQGTGRLLSDSREAARTQAGLDTDNFAWDIVRHPSVPGFNYGGLAFVRGKGVWLQSSGTGVTSHELGHNYGLWHANYWTANGGSIIGPGTHEEYGNSFDTMGAASAGANHFNAAFKYQLDWLPVTFVHNVTSNGTYRIYTFDAPNIVSGQKYAIKVRKDYDRNYWAEFRQRFPNNRWFVNGVHLNWDPWDNGVSDSAGGTHLLDTTPGTPDGKNDCPVVVGRTFSDVPAGVHITPVARSSSSENWIDVVVNVGAFSNNLPPVASLIADRLSAGVGANVNFSVSALDPDGDDLAFAWDFGDATFGPNAPSVAKNWATAGEYTVRCTVSDMKGGTYSQKATITVGAPTTFRISGRVTTAGGAPLEGVRVHNGLTGAAYRGTYTDSDGYYVVANNAAGSYTVGAVKYGYIIGSDGWANPVAVGPHATNRNFTATAMPVVSIVAADGQANEASAGTGQFMITRTGATNVALVVKMNRSGTAVSSTDYSLNPNPAGAPLQLTIPVGAASLPVTVTPVNDTASEGPESVLLTLQDDPAYVLGSLAEAAVTIVDDEVATLPSVDISASTPGLESDNLATESGSDSGVFTFTRTGNVSGELTVSYSVTGTATADMDYHALSGVITIPAGQTLVTLPFRVIDDIEVESNETVVVTILANPAYLGAGDNTSITIVDDDLTTVFVTAADDTARENNASGGTFVISRVGRLDLNLVVDYAVVGTASAGADYPALSGTITIPAGRATMNIAVPATNDGLTEGEETVVLQLSSSASYNVGNPGSATITIIDDEAANVTLTASDATATEGGDTGAFTFTRAGGNMAAPLEVFFEINGTATPGGDYAAIPNLITIPAGAATFVLTITPVDDTINETAERVALTLLPSATYTRTTVAPVAVTINSNDGGLPGIGFTIAESGGLESVTGPLVSVTLSAVSASVVTVNYAVTGGGATGGGADYTLAAGTLTFLPSTNNQSFRITVVNDTAVETNETIRISLSAPSNAQLDANATHTYTIIDDDQAGNVTVTALDATGSEAGDPAVFRIARSGSTVSNLMVGFQVLGSASSPTDYETIASSVTIPAGASFIDLPIIPVDDAADETNETVTINLLSAPGGRIGTPDLATVTILDNDDSTTLPAVNIVATDPVASEPGSDTATLTISRTGDTSSDLTVTFSVGGSAGSGDYTAIGTTATIPAGASAATVTITPLDDSTFETNETVIVTLTLLSHYRVGVSAVATAVIEDNEVGVSIVAEGSSSESGSSTGLFVITRTGTIVSDLTVNFSVAGTATRPADYSSFSNSVVIPAGTNAVSIPVEAVNDTVAEGTETVVASLLAGAGYTVRAPSSATVLILDDEPVVTIAALDNTAHEAGGDGLFTIIRSGNTASALTVNFTIGGTASNGIDYVALPSQVVLAAGQTSSNLAVVVIDDPATEGPEVVSITLNTNAAYFVGSPSSAVVTIIDNEINTPPAVQITNPRSDLVFMPSNTLFLVLESRISDDGRPNPPGVVTSVWTRVSGPGTVTFGNATSSNTFARFSANGVYVLRLTADDGQLQNARDLTVIVNPPRTLQTGLQGYWRFDETSGATAADSSGNNRVGTVVGPAWTPGGRLNYALDFDGVDDVVSFNSPAAAQVSVAAWIYTEGDGDSTTPRVMAMPGYNMRVRRDDDSIAFESERATTAGQWRSATSSHVDNVWRHVIVTYDSASAAVPAIYIDGQPQTITTITSPSGAQLVNTGTGYIGNQAALDRSLDGRIDEVRLYNRIITAAEALVLPYGAVTNLAPVANAGPDRSASGGGSVLLSGSVTDDGQPNPPASVSNLWTKFSGPGTVTFGNPRAASTTATFSDPGTYTLSLNSDDGQVTVFDQMTVTVVAAPVVSVATAAGPAAEFGPVTGAFMISRGSGTAVALTISFAVGGSASNGVDYSVIPTQVTLQAGASSTLVNIDPILDGAAEGDETVILTLTSDASYSVGANSSSSLTINDRPYDAWRFGHFTAGQLGNPAVSGDGADADGDGLKTLIEYGLNLDPLTSNSVSRFSGSIEQVSPGERAFVVAHTRRKAPRDINYVVEVSSDLLTWNSGAAITQELSTVDDGNGVTETVRLRVISDVNAGGQRFTRLRVTKQ